MKSTCGTLSVIQFLRMISLIILHVGHLQGTLHERSMEHSQQASRGLSLVSEQCCRVWTSSSLSCWHRFDLQLQRIARRPSVIKHLAFDMNSLLLFRKVSTRSSTQVPPPCARSSCQGLPCEALPPHRGLQKKVSLHRKPIRKPQMRLTSSRFCAGLASARQPCVA